MKMRNYYNIIRVEGKKYKFWLGKKDPDNTVLCHVYLACSVGQNELFIFYQKKMELFIKVDLCKSINLMLLYLLNCLFIIMNYLFKKSNKFISKK